MAKVAREFQAVRPGNVYPETIAVGEEVTGRLAEIAAALDALEGAETTPVKATRAAKRAPEVKA
jgi:hypothetical protein